MKWDTKVLICMCGAMAVLAHIQGNYHVAGGWIVAFAGWFVVGLKERREVK